ncbi:PPE domain-containing protein [Streptomyces sp. NBC_01186]|uniref:PPE domain-containing protein n=1 Tax=Streptomyces sp. NBC_01186 TaxID=2903765 RepID=UPI002E124B5C|nr:PPE domain-containing protein [Streptomyces sp. NBC_01186]
MTLEYADVRNVNLTPLQEAAHKWTKLGKKFSTVETHFNSTVSNPLRTSNWKGDARDAAVKRFDHVKRQITEAAGEADDVGRVMTEALHAFKWAKEELKAIIEDVETPAPDGKKYLKVNRENGVVYLDPPADAKDTAGLQKAYHETIVSYTRRTHRALEFASTADRRLKTALGIDHNGAAKGFTSDGLAHLKDVDKETKADAEAATKLANDENLKEDPKKLSQLNGLLAKNSLNSRFAEQFTTGMGAKGMMEFWKGAAQPPYSDGVPPMAEKRPAGVTKQLAALQDNLGVTMGLASHSDSPAMTAWKKDVLEVSGDRIGTVPYTGRAGASNPPYGFQVMSNLMRTGKWDTAFLNDYGDALMKKDKDSYIPYGLSTETDQDTHRKWLTQGVTPADYLNFGAKWDQGEDPFTGYFEALGHNSDASSDFFQDEENFDHVLRDRMYLPDGEVPESGAEKDFNGPRVALGHALASATTGHDWDAPLNVPAEHTKDQADLMSKLIKGMGTVDEDGNADISMSPGMRPGLGNAAAEYTPDFFRAMKDGGGADKLFPMSGAEAGLDHRDATKFLVQLGQDPDANATITAGQKLYTAQVLDHHLGGDVPAGEKYNAPPQDIVHEVLKTSGETAGTLASGAQEGIIGPAVVEDQEYDKATLSNRLWANGAFGAVVTGASVMPPFTATPVGAATAASLIIGAEGAALNDQDAAHWSSNASAPAADRAGAIYDEMAGRDVRQNEEMLKAIGKEHGVKISDSWAELYSDEGFSQGYSRVGSTAPFLTSIEQVKQMAVEK